MDFEISREILIRIGINAQVQDKRFFMSKRRVVVTGMGLVTPLGLSISHVWDKLISGYSGIVSLKDRIHPDTNTAYTGINSQVAALVPRQGPFSYSPEAHFTKSVVLDHLGTQDDFSLYPIQSGCL